MKAALIAALVTVPAEGFLNTAPVFARTARSAPRMAAAASDGVEFVPSEEFFAKYLGKAGLRYAMAKTEEEVAKEGDYTFFQKMFGQTSNNAARMQLKREVRVATAKPKDPAASKAWMDKYGWPRYFPAYVDIAGEDVPIAAAAPAAPVVAAVAPVAVAAAIATAAPKKTAAPTPAKKPMFSSPAKAAPKAAPAAPKVAAKPVVKVTASAKPVIKAAAKPVVKAVPKPAAPKPVEAPKLAVSPAKLALLKAPAAKKGSIGNIPKRVTK